MKYTVKLLEADTINKNNRCYSKKVVEEINEQLNSNIVNVYNNSIYYDSIYYDPTAENKTNFGDIIGQTIKCSSRIEADTLFVDVNLRKPISTNFINLCCVGLSLRSNTKKKDYNGNVTAGLNCFSHWEVRGPKVLYLFKDNTNSYYDDSNIVSQNKLEIE